MRAPSFALLCVTLSVVIRRWIGDAGKQTDLLKVRGKERGQAKGGRAVKVEREIEEGVGGGKVGETENARFQKLATNILVRSIYLSAVYQKSPAIASTRGLR